MHACIQHNRSLTIHMCMGTLPHRMIYCPSELITGKECLTVVELVIIKLCRSAIDKNFLIWKLA